MRSTFHKGQEMAGSSRRYTEGRLCLVPSGGTLVPCKTRLKIAPVGTDAPVADFE